MSSLPRGITPGHVTIVNMEGGRLPTPPPSVLPPPPQIPLALQLHDMDMDLDNNSHNSDPTLQLTAEPNLGKSVYCMNIISLLSEMIITRHTVFYVETSLINLLTYF